MKKKFLLPLLLGLSLPLVGILISCGGGGDNTPTLTGIEMRDKNTKEAISSVFNYTYGDTFEFMGDITAYKLMSDGTSVEVTTEEAASMQVTYSYNGGEQQAFTDYQKAYDVGNYCFYFTYQGKSGTLSANVEQATRTNNKYHIAVHKVSGGVATSVTWGTSSIDETLVSEYCLRANDESGKKAKVDNVYYMSQEEKTAYDALTDFNEKQSYLENLSTRHSASYNDDATEAGDLYLITNYDDVEIGENYYLFAYVYSEKNYKPFYTEPIDNNKFTFAKNRIDLKNSVVDENGQNVSFNDFLTALGMKFSFSYNMSYFDEEDIAHYVVGSRTVDEILKLRSDAIKTNDTSSLSYNLILAGGSFNDLFTIMEVEIINPNKAIDYSVNGTNLAVKYVFNEGFMESTGKFYDLINNQFNIPIEVIKGEIYKPYIEGEEPEFTFALGEEISLPIVIDFGTNELFEFKGETKARTVGTHSCYYKILDEVNYTYKEDTSYGTRNYGDENHRFSWKITKASFNFENIQITYNDEAVTSIDYVPGVNEFEFSVLVGENYAPYVEDKTFNFTIEGTNNVTVSQVEQNGLTMTYRIDSIDSYLETNFYFNVKVVSEEDTNFLDFEIYEQIYINPSSISEAEEALMFGSSGVINSTKEGENIYYVADSSVEYIIYKEDNGGTYNYYLHSSLPTIPDGVETEGSLVLRKRIGDGEYKVIEGTAVEGKGILLDIPSDETSPETYYQYNMEIVFIPNDPCIRVVVCLLGLDNFEIITSLN